VGKRSFGGAIGALDNKLKQEVHNMSLIKKIKKPKNEKINLLYGRFTLYVCGITRDNSEKACIAALLLDPYGKYKARGSQYIGRTTNNEAEYDALNLGLWLAKKYGVHKLQIYMDSENVVQQLTGEYQFVADNVRPFWNKAKGRLNRFDSVKLRHIRREKNLAARLVTPAVNKASHAAGQA
jgi:ribonuclease HI